MLVGREQELTAINAAYRQMMDGKGSVLFLTGEAGLGKTVLVHEWWKTASSSSAIYAEAACSIPLGNIDVGALEALQPWADIIAQLQAYDDEKKKFDMKRLIHDAAPAWAWAIPVIGDLAHAAVETHRLIKEQRRDMNHNQNAANQQQVFQQYVNLIVSISKATPLVILLDDMHWADTSSTNLLFHLSRQIATNRILVLVTYRPDEALMANKGEGHPVIKVKNEILRYDNGKEIAIGYLDEGSINALLVKIFGDYQKNTLFEKWLQKISDGNSLFVTQFIRTLQEDRRLDEHGAFSGEFETVSIPSSALAVVTERTRRLDDATRELLSYATAEGEEFTSYVLGQLTSKKPLELLRDLRKAESAGLVQSKKITRQFAGQTTSVFGFSHTLFHKALYDGLLPEERSILHRQCYEILKTEWDRLADSQERSMPLATKLLMHAEKCGELRVAAEAAYWAADSAWQKFSEAEALEMIAHCMRFAGSNHTKFAEQERHALLGKAALLRTAINILRGRFNEAFNDAEAADTECDLAGDQKNCVMARRQKAWILFNKGEYERAEADAEKTLAFAQQIGDQVGVSQILNVIGVIHSNTGENEKALEYYTRSLSVEDSGIANAARALTLNNMGAVHSNLGDHGMALEYYKRSLKELEAADYRTGIAMVLNNMGNVYSHTDRFSMALDCHSRSISIRESIGDQAGLASSFNNIGNVYIGLKEYDKALEYCSRSVDIGRSINFPLSVVFALCNIGTVWREQNRLAEARKYFEDAHALAVELRARPVEANVLCYLASACNAEAENMEGDARKEKLQEAIQLFEKGIDIFRETGAEQSNDAVTAKEELELIRNKLTE